MKISKILIGLIFTLTFINTAQACINADTKRCPLVTETTAYVDHTEPVVSGADVGKIYKAYMANIEALAKSGDFKNFKIISQSMDIKPSYDGNSITTALMRVTIKFDLNYDAISDIYEKLKGSTVNISTYETRKCSE